MKSRVSPERLFQALDGTQLSVDGVDWQVQVFGVIDEPSRRWVQVALEGSRRSVVTLRLMDTQSPRQVARELSAWPSDRHTASSVLARVA